MSVTSWASSTGLGRVMPGASDRASGGHRRGPSHAGGAESVWSSKIHVTFESLGAESQETGL